MDKEKNKIEQTPEQKQIEQKIEINPDKGVSVVIEQISNDGFKDSTGKYHPAKVGIEKNGKIIENFRKRFPNLKFYVRAEPKEWEKGNWYYDADIRAVLMPKTWKNNKEILKFIHELGHGIYNSKHPQAEKNKKDLLEKKNKLDELEFNQ